jgi:indole-3-glycerol phosphate synthase
MKNLPGSNGLRAVGGVLDKIVQAKAKRLEGAKRDSSRSDVERKALDAVSRRPIVSLARQLNRPRSLNIIAEIKHRSPSKGVIRADFDPVRLAEGYARGGAAALSVLAEEDFFGGSLGHLTSIRDRVELPLLRKDFIFDEYQIYESAAAGADAVLLIVALLDDELLKELSALAKDIGLDALVEVHTPGEMERAAKADAMLIGVNNRDLTTFKVDLRTSVGLSRLAPAGATLVSESGIHSEADIHMLEAAGFHAFLIGERFMRADEPGLALERLIALCES